MNRYEFNEYANVIWSDWNKIEHISPYDINKSAFIGLSIYRSKKYGKTITNLNNLLVIKLNSKTSDYYKDKCYKLTDLVNIENNLN